MLIPKCCKGCSSKGSGVCNCTLPAYCQEYVEDEEIPIKVVFVNATDKINGKPNIGELYIGDPYPCGIDGTNTELQKNWWNGTWRNYEQSIGNWSECLNCKEKDHRIAVLERALWNAITIGHSKRRYNKKGYYKAIEQAEKELEGEE